MGAQTKHVQTNQVVVHQQTALDPTARGAYEDTTIAQQDLESIEIYSEAELLRNQAAAAEIISPSIKNIEKDRYTATSLVIDASPPENRMLNSKNLCVLRPELLSVLDFQSLTSTLQDSSGKNSKLLKARIAKRKMQLESAVAALNSAVNLDYENYLVAKTQYESALAAAASEIAFLKIAYTFKVYAELGPSFTSFIKFYEFNPSEFTTNTIDMGGIGTTFKEYMIQTMDWNNSMDIVLDRTISAGKDATLLLQLINDLAFSCAIATPNQAYLGRSHRFLGDYPIQSLPSPSENTAILNVFGDINSGVIGFQEKNVGIIRLCRDLTASSQIGKIIAEEGDEDEVLRGMLEKYVESNYFTSTTAPNPSLFKHVFGWDPYGSYYKKLTNSSAGQRYFQYVPDFASYENGLVSELFTIDSTTCVVSTDSDTYQTSEAVGTDSSSMSIPEKTFAGVKSLVDKGFSSSGKIDLGLYSSQVSKLQDNLEDASNIFLQLFKLLDKRGTVLGETGSAAANTHPTSPLNFSYNVQKIINDRYSKNFGKYIGLNPSLLRVGEEIDTNTEAFYKCWGIHFIMNYPEFAKGIIEKFVEDYEKGFLTFSDTVSVEEITYTETHFDGKSNTSQEVKVEAEIRSNVYPGTSTSTDLSGQRGGLYAYLVGLLDDIKNHSNTSDELSGGFATEGIAQTDQMYSGMMQETGLIWNPYSPTRTFCGTWDTEENKELRNFMDTILIDGIGGSLGGDASLQGGEFGDTINQFAGDASKAVGLMILDSKILEAWQSACIMWAKDVESDGYLPANIIPVAACVIDAVMTVLYNCLSPVMEIQETSSTDSWFPAVESKAPPYNKQIFTLNSLYASGNMDFIAGFGSFTSINTGYWVPVLNAMVGNMTRSEDKKMLFSGAPISSILGGVIDAMNSSNPLKDMNCTLTKSVNPSVQGVPTLLSLDRPAHYTNELQIPQFGKNKEALIGGVRNFTGAGLTDNSAMFLEFTNSTAQALYGDTGISTDNYGAAAFGTYHHHDTSLGWFYSYGVYLFGNMQSTMGLGDWGAMVNVSDDINNSAATPSQLLDRLTSSALTPEDKLNLILDQWAAAFENAAKTEDDPGDDILTALIYVVILFMGMAGSSIDGKIFPDNAEGLENELRDMFEGMGDQFNVIAEQIGEDPSGLSSEHTMQFLELIDGYFATLAASDIAQSWKLLPWPIWLIHNLAGDASDSPITELLSKSISSISVAEQAGVMDSIFDQSSSWWLDDTQFGGVQLSKSMMVLAKQLLNAEYEDIRLGVGLDILRKYSERISTYAETAVDGLTTESDSEQSSLEILLEELGQTQAGNDVLGNLTPEQLNLKTAALNRQKGDESNGYVSHSEIITPKQLKALELMMQVSSLFDVEGANIKTSVVGIPATLFSTIYDENATYSGPNNTEINSSMSISGKDSPLFGMRVSANLPDYPIFSIIPKLFRFDYELYVQPDAFDELTIDSTTGKLMLEGVAINDWEDLVRATSFTRYRFLTIEGSPGESDPVFKADYAQKEKLSELTTLDSANEDFYDIYSNTLASYLLEKYYKLVVGLGMSEDDFCTAKSGLEIPINEYAIDFASALGSIYTDLESGLDSTKIESLFMPLEDIEALTYNTLSTNASKNASVSSYSNMVSTFSSEIASGEFTEVESSLFESFTNAASSRLFSAESMRDKILGAKYFDRVLYILVDPDEFQIASWDLYKNQIEAGAIKTSITQNCKNIYEGYQQSLINSGEFLITEDDPTIEGLQPVKMRINTRADEGSMSFGSLMFTIVRGVNETAPYGVTLSETDPNNVMITTTNEERDR